MLTSSLLLLSVCEEVSSEYEKWRSSLVQNQPEPPQHQRRSSLVQEEAPPPHIKEEQQEILLKAEEADGVGAPSGKNCITTNVKNIEQGD